MGVRALVCNIVAAAQDIFQKALFDWHVSDSIDKPDGVVMTHKSLTESEDQRLWIQSTPAIFNPRLPKN